MLPPTGTVGVSTILELGQRKVGQRAPSNAALNIRATLDAAGAKANAQQIIRSSLLRLQGVAQEVIQPGSEFEKVGGFLTLTGQPFKVIQDERGQLTAIAQSESDLREYTPSQQAQIRTALTELDDLISKQDLQDTKSDLLAEISFGAVRVAEMNQLFSPPQELWEMQFQNFKATGKPVKVALDANGQLQAVDILNHDFTEIENVNDRLKLVQARDQLAAILDGTQGATELWQFEALGNKLAGDDYFIDLDDNGDVVIRRNEPEFITPDFLTEEQAVETTAPWQEDALRLYNERKGFFFDFNRATQELEVVEISFASVSGITNPLSGLGDVQASLVSLIT